MQAAGALLARFATQLRDDLDRMREALAPCLLEGLRLGARRIHTASRPLADGVSHSSVGMMLRNVSAAGYDADLDEEPFDRIVEHLVGVAEGEGWPVGHSVEPDLTTYQPARLRTAR